MKVLLIDNKSAHLLRLKELLREKLGSVSFTLRDPREMRNSDVEAADLIVVSGGAGRSIIKNPQTFKRMVRMAMAHHKPTIGICLGAEAVAAAFDAPMRELPVRRVGNVRIHFTKDFADLGDSIMAYEFHKWLIESVPLPLKALATSKDGVEILRHRTLPLWGVQFHPEVRRLDNKGHLVFEYILRDLGLPVKGQK
jgi:anthranilate/para-aminobenzoate synthase component II